MVLKNFLQVYRVLYCGSALHMVGVGNQASSPSSKNTLRTICTSTKVEIFLLVPGHPGTTPSYAPALPLALAMLESSCSTYTGSSSSGNASHHDSRARYQQKQCLFWPYSAELCCFFKICVFCRKFCRHYPPDPTVRLGSSGLGRLRSIYDAHITR